MVEQLSNLNPVLQALMATTFTWAMTAFGAAFVFVPGNVSRRWLDTMLGFAAGVMIAASYWSLLAPSIELSESMGRTPWVAPALGFAAGGAFLGLVDRVIPHLHLNHPMSAQEGPRTSWHRCVLLVIAVTLHNIPEGLAVGVAFGAAANGLGGASTAAALALALGIGLQNFPEGMVISAPLRREGLTRFRSFWYGQLSGVVEPVAGVIGAAAVILMKSLLPYALAFAAGAMIFVVIEELIPESQQGGNSDLATMGAMGGFIVMMILDVAFS